GVELVPRRVDRDGLAALAGALDALGRGARTGDLAGSVPPASLRLARANVGAVTRWTGTYRQVSGAGAAFDDLRRRATPRVGVTPVAVAACVLVYLAMTLTGVAPENPGAAALFRWGGGSGVAVAVDGQSWRLLTGMFLHGGLLHLVLNMWCLASSGPVVE